MCLDALFGSKDASEDVVIQQTPAPIIARATPVIAEDTGANVVYGADAAEKRSTRNSKRNSSEIKPNTSSTSKVGLYI